MKKVLLFVAVAGMVTLTSCKKDWSCNCTDGTETADVFSSEYSLDGLEQGKDMKKKDAKELCDAQETLYKTFVPDFSCSLEAK